MGTARELQRITSEVLQPAFVRCVTNSSARSRGPGHQGRWRAWALPFTSTSFGWCWAWNSGCRGWASCGP